MFTKVFSVCLLIFCSTQLTRAQGLTVRCDSNSGPTSQNLIYSYSDTCTVTGGTAPYTWSLSSAILPAGLQVNGQSATSNIVASAITISGVVQQAGQYYYGFSVYDSSTPYQNYGSSPYFSGSVNPLLNALAPAYVGSGGPDLTITATGAGFVNHNSDSSRATVVTWNGTNLTTAFVDSSHVTALVPANLTASPGTASVQVSVGSVYGGSFYSSVTSLPLTFTIDLPAITSLSPASARVNGDGFTLAVNGTGFVSGATVLWNNAALATTLVSATQLTATVPAGFLSSAGTVQVNVVSGGVSTANVPFTIVPATITSLSPSTVTATGPGFTLTVNGAGFDSNAIVLWGGTTLTTTFINSTQLTAAVPASLITNAGSFAIQVQSGGAATLTSLPFTVVAAPTLASLNPSSATAGGAAFNLSITGTGFGSDATVLWNGAALATTFASATQLSAAVPASLISTAGSIPIMVVSGGIATATNLNFTIAAAPTLASLTPSAAIAGSAGFVLTVAGTGFSSAAVVLWNGAALTATSISDTQMSAMVPASLLLTPGSFPVSVVGGGVASNALSFAVLPPSATTISPATVTAGTAGFTLTVSGANFSTDASIFWNSTALITTFVSATSLSAVVPSSFITAAGTAQITITSGGLTAGPLLLTIVPGPAITSLNPASATVTDPAFTLQVNGTDFGANSVIFWGATALTTTVVSPTQVTAAVSASLLTTAGSFPVSVASRGAVSTPSLFIVNPIPAPAVSLTGLQPTAMPATSLSVGVQVASASAYDMQGTLQLSFTPSVSGLPAGYMDPALQFASGGTSVNFTLAAGSSLATVPQGGLIQLGTVAGTIAVSITSLTANGVNVLPGAAVTGTVIVSPLPPVIVTDSLKIINVTDGGFTVQLTGYSTTREVSSADFVLTAAPGARLLGNSDISVQTGAAFTTWFGSTQSQTYGSQFVMQVPFTISGGTSNIVQSVSVTLTNSAGTSTAVSASK